jgi:hypothetical protein
MLALPLVSVLGEHFFAPGAAPLTILVGKWFVFWGVGVRLALAGGRQVFQPEFTAKEIFGIKGNDALPIVRELGVSNLATGIVGILSLAFASFVLPVAIAAAIFYGVAGFRHAARRERTSKESIAMLSDLFAFAVLFGYVGLVAVHRA